ncbi:DNA-binding domain-containing protein [Aquabacterium sp. A7-Y]|uniref:HvfC/BufC family peptide modification chaperone n=1 Tax=Aquabacterium sp. A7-Y TaxID=1349605 RepID=UPI00223E77BE|nr:putative DNA-binding domain-containing protein [Aquabacterium sp. A7-Y]MCW7538806.1 DNA-binding domain-containing protein [Aquabacterium sp. A7-Y]
MTPIERERLRQQRLVQAVLREADAGSMQECLRRDGQRGLAAYRANASASAARALGVAFPTLKAMLGEADFEILAACAWHRQPPERGDLGEYGDSLPGLVEDSASLHRWPYLADCARLDWAVHRAARAADAEADLASLEALNTCEPHELQLRLRPGIAVLASAWPIVSIWQAHRALERGHAAALDALPGQLAQGQGEVAVVYRRGWRVEVEPVSLATGAWMQDLLQGLPLDCALDRRDGADFDLAAWLAEAVRRGWLWRAELVKAQAASVSIETSRGEKQ